MLSAQQKSAWLKAQEAEKGHWIELWSNNVNQQVALLQHEALKADFIFDQMTSHFKVDPKKDWANLTVLDAGCGPTSVIARRQLGQERAGVDPLQYPDWVYLDYKKRSFKVIMKPFEELTNKQKFDVIIFYNALQHFANLGEVARQCLRLISPKGKIYLSEYLEVPTNEAHIQYLEATKLDGLFEGASLKIESTKKPVHLPGLVEKPNNQPIDLYIARLSPSN